MYLLTNSVVASEIGRIPQVQDSNIYKEQGTHIFGDFLSTLNKRFEKDMLSKLTFTLHYKAKITDYLDSSNTLLVSEKLLNILLDSNIENYQYFEVEVYHKKKQYKYYLFVIYGQNYDLVDYENMTFYGESNPPYSDFYREPHEQEGIKRKEIKVEKPQQIINWQKLYPDYPNREYETLKLNHANIYCDMIRLPFLVGGYYFVSAELRDKIVEQKCTGIAFRTKDWKERPIQ